MKSLVEYRIIAIYSNLQFFYYTNKVLFYFMRFCDILNSNKQSKRGIIMANVIIIGNGPAGISAGLYTKRANIDTLIIGRDAGALKKADKIENYYGFIEPIGGTELIDQGIEQAKRLGCEVINDEVVSLGFEDRLVVKTKENTYHADAIIISTGTARNTPKIKGIAEFEGSGVSYCAVCDAFFYRGKDVAVLGSGEYAIHEAMELLPVVKSVTLLTNGVPLTVTVPEGISVNENKIAELKGESVLKEVSFENGDVLEIAGLFVAVGVASSSDLARKIGAQIEGVNIVVDKNMATNVPGLYAAGDCVGGMLQIAKAVHDGAEAAMSVIKYVRKLK